MDFLCKFEKDWLKNERENFKGIVFFRVFGLRLALESY